MIHPRDFEKIPAHIRYPGMIVGFLVMSVIGQMIVLNRALDGDGLQVESNYYQKALKFESNRHERLRWVKQMGDIKLDTVGKRADGRRMAIQITNAPPNNIRPVHVEAKRPALAKAQHQRSVTSWPGEDRRWFFDIPSKTRGVWDFEITWKHNDGSITTTHRIHLK